MNTSVRALGMGNAYTAIVKDADSLFYNPAGIPQVRGVNWLILDGKMGANGDEVLKTISKVQGTGTFANTVRSLYGDHVWLGAGAKTAFYMPFFAFSVYDHFDSSLGVHNPVYPNLDISVVNDYGYAIGTGFGIGPAFNFGLDVKYIQRTGARVPFGPTYVGGLNPDAIMTQLESKGTGYSLDLGATIRVPGPVSPSFAFVWKNVGITKFEASTATLAAPPPQRDEMILGAAVDFDAGIVSITPVFDFKHLNRTDVQLMRKIHLGVEIGLPVLDIRAGFNEGYYTLGLGVNLGLMRLDAATYGVEMGEYPGQREDRRYILQFTLELGFDPAVGFLGGGSGGGSGGPGGKKSAGSGSNSWGGGKKLKQRR